MMCVSSNGLSGGLGHGQADMPRFVENDGVAVDDLKRLHRVAALVADHGVLPDALDMCLGPDLIAGRTARRDIRIAEAVAAW